MKNWTFSERSAAGTTLQSYINFLYVTFFNRRRDEKSDGTVTKKKQSCLDFLLKFVNGQDNSKKTSFETAPANFNLVINLDMIGVGVTTQFDC